MCWRSYSDKSIGPFFRKKFISANKLSYNMISHLKRVIPESRIKELLRWYYRTNHYEGYVRHGTEDYDNVSVRFKDRNPVFRFLEGPLASMEIIFAAGTEHVLLVPAELPGYFNRRIPDNAFVIDAGAYPGDYTVAAAQMAVRGMVVALEPNPLHLKVLRHTLQANRVDHDVCVLPYALSNVCGEGYLFETDGVESKLVSKSDPDKRNLIQVNTTTADHLIKTYNRDELPVFVKMDIEGGEIRELEGAQNAIKSGAHFAIASYHVIRGRRTFEPVKKLFEASGYSVTSRNPDHLTLIAERA